MSFRTSPPKPAGGPAQAKGPVRMTPSLPPASSSLHSAQTDTRTALPQQEQGPVGDARGEAQEQREGIGRAPSASQAVRRSRAAALAAALPSARMFSARATRWGRDSSETLVRESACGAKKGVTDALRWALLAV